MTTRIQVSDAGLEVIPPRDTLTQGSENTLTIEFQFSGQWLECTEINAVFTDDINSATTPVTGGACVIPVEVLQNPWRFVSLSLNGTSASGVITSPFVRIGQVLPSAMGGEGGKFVTMAQLMEILQGYVKTEDLGVYVTQDELEAAIATLATQDDIADLENSKADKTQLADYWSKAEIGLQTDGDGKQFLANDGKYYEVQGGGGDEKTFIAEYNVTTAQEIIAFLDAAKEPFAPMLVKRGADYYTVTTAEKQDADKVIIRTFATLSGNYYMFQYTITGSTWATASYGFQKMLESGTNIKTINGQSLLGSGDITIQGGTQEQADWNQTDDTSPAYIKNKPTIPDVSGLATQASVDAVSDTVSALETRVSTNETNISALQNDKADKTQLDDYETSEHAAATYETKSDASKIKSITAAGFAVTPDAAGNVNIGGTDVTRVANSGSWGSEITYTISQTLPAGASSDTKGSTLTIFKRTENSGATPRITMTIDGVQIATSADIPDVSRFATTDYVQDTFESTAHASETYLKISDAASTYATQTAISDMATQTWVQNYIASLDGTNMQF